MITFSIHLVLIFSVLHLWKWLPPMNEGPNNNNNNKIKNVFFFFKVFYQANLIILFAHLFMY
jgi:hypothetical protein